jgi:hypothetical protein
MFKILKEKFHKKKQYQLKDFMEFFFRSTVSANQVAPIRQKWF